MRIPPAQGPLTGRLSVPGDKSIAHRALMLGALSQKGLAVRNLPAGLDVASTARVLAGLCANVKRDGANAVVSGRAGRLAPPAGPLFCGNSGTTMRLAAGILAGHPFASVLTGDPSLSARPMRRVAEPLARMGAEVSLADGHPPLSILGRRPLKAVEMALDVPSAQVKSAVILAGLLADGITRIRDPFGTRDHTERMLAALAPRSIRMEPGLVEVIPSGIEGGGSIEVPGDFSSAAFFFAAAAIVEGSAVTVEGVGLNPSRAGFLDVLRRMDGTVETGPAAPGPEPAGSVTVRHAPLSGTRVEPREIPSLVDEIPALAVVATQARGETRIEGAGELRVKESDRLAGLAAGLSAMGGDVRVEGDALVIHGPTPLSGGAVETLGDHRLAMAFSVAALVAKGETILSDGDCAAVSYPGFFKDLERLQAR